MENVTQQYELISWEECYICLTDRKLKDEIRAIYCRLLYDIFINIGSNFINEETVLVYNYDDLETTKGRKGVAKISGVS